MEIIERPYNISFSLNDIRYIFQLDQSTGVQLQVKILFASKVGDTWQELTTYLLQPGTDGKVYLYLQDILNSRLEYVLPAFTEGSYNTHAADQYGIYTIQYRVIDQSGNIPAFITTEQNFLQYVIKGGIEKHLHSRNNFFKYFEASQPFLTWQPSGRFIDTNQAAYLTFLNPYYYYTDLSQSFILCYRVTDINGNTEEIQGPIAQGLLIHLQLKLKASLATSMALADLYSLEIGVVKSGDPFAYKYTFYFEQRPVYSYYDLTYINSLGGIDCLRVKGDVTESLDRTTQDGYAGININDPFAAVKEHENIFAGILLQKKFKGDIGYLRSKQLQYSLTDVLASQAIYMRNAWRWVPVLNLQKSQEYGTKRDSLNKFPIEWELSEQNEVFTPDLALAMGDNSRLEPPPPPVCANVTGLSADIRDDGSGNKYIHFAFTPVAGVKDYKASLVNIQYNFVEEDIDLIWDLSTQPLEGSFPTYVTPAVYRLVITTICNTNPLNVSSGASVNIEQPAPPAPAFCPVVTGYSFTANSGSSIVATVTMHDIVSSNPDVQSVSIMLYNAATNQVIATSTVYDNSPYHIFDNLQPGSYYAKIQTNCTGSTSQLITTNTVAVAPAYLIKAAATDAHTIMLYCTDNGGAQVQMPFNATVQLDVTYTQNGLSQHTTVQTTFQAGLSQSMGYANYNATGITQFAITGLTPRTQNGITINF